MKELGAISAVLILVTLLLPTAVTAQQPPECEFEYTVQKDDRLSQIADKYYDDMLAYSVIVEATNAQSYPVITQGNPTYRVEVMVEKVN